jgi:hypothetical protein
MRAAHRWGLAAAATALAVLTPYAARLHGVDDPHVAVASLVAQVRASAATPYSGTVEAQGNLGLPIADHFSDLADLFGGQTRLRVWWRSDTSWRVDRLLDTGEVDLYHHGRVTTEWNYERDEARTSTDPEIRLPRDSDLLPPEVARRALDGQPTGNVTALPARRVAGVDAAGLRVQITDPRSTIRHVDLWVDPATGVTLSAEVYGDASQSAVSTTFTTYSPSTPSAEVTAFHAAPGVPDYPDRAIDIADAADQFAPVTTPTSVAGFARSSGVAAAVYGTGLTRLLVIPLPFRDADVLASQLKSSGAATVKGQQILRVGPLGVMVTRGSGRIGVRWLVGGTVTDTTLLEAARDLAAGARIKPGAR